MPLFGPRPGGPHDPSGSGGKSKVPPLPASAGVGDSSLVPLDQDIVKFITFKVLDGGHQVKFQFPPKIISEGNKSEWDQHDLWSIEPLKIHKGSQGRSVSMEWEYVCTDSNWNGELIARITKELKTYFFEFKREVYPVVVINFPPIIPDTSLKWRLMSADISYSPELVVQGQNIYPLHTKVNVALELATKINNRGGQDAKLIVEPLGFAKYSWY